MAEAIKGVIYGRDKIDLGPLKYKYLIGITLLTDKPIDKASLRGETIVGHLNTLDSPMTSALQSVKCYKPPFPLGDLSQGVILVSDMDLRDLEEKQHEYGR